MGCSAKQYTDIYDANQALLSGDRSAARQALASAELDDAFAADYGLNLNRVALPVNVADSFRCGVPTVSTAMALVVNDTFAPTARLDERLPQGVRFMSLGDAMRECPQLVTPHLHVADGDPLTQLNDLLVQDGVFIYIPRGVRLQRPLQLVNIFSAPIDLMAVRRVVIVVEEGAEGKLLVCDHTQDRSRRYLGLQLVQISLADGAAFQLHDIEESSPLTTRRYSLRCRLAAHSSLRLSVSTLSGGDTANDIRIDLDGDGAEALSTAWPLPMAHSVRPTPLPCVTTVSTPTATNYSNMWPTANPMANSAGPSWSTKARVSPKPIRQTATFSLPTPPECTQSLPSRSTATR